MYHYHSFKNGARATEVQQVDSSSFADCQISPLTEASEITSERKFGTTTSSSTLNKSNADIYRPSSGHFGKKPSGVRLISVTQSAELDLSGNA